MNDILKGLQTQISKIESDIQSIKIDIGNKNKELNTKQKILGELKSKVNSLKKSDKPIVSEHAILRYCERVKGINIEEIEKEILNDSVLNLVEKLGSSGTYPNNNGYQVRMKDNVVVTILI